MSNNDDRKPQTMVEALRELAAARDDLFLAIGEALLPAHRFLCGTPARLLVSVFSAIGFLAVVGWVAEGTVGVMAFVFVGVVSWFLGRALARLHR